MDKIQIYGLIINLIIYFLITLPIEILSFINKIYKNQKKFILVLYLSIIYSVITSVLLYSFPYKIFSIFTSTKGIINYGVYAFKILFISSSLYSIKILIPKYISCNFKTKKIAIFKISKIALTILFSIISCLLFNTKGILFTIPIIDFIYSIIYIFLLFKNIKSI